MLIQRRKRKPAEIIDPDKRLEFLDIGVTNFGIAIKMFG
jgi:hypothetical protein